MTQKNVVLLYLKHNRKWIPSYDLVKISTPYGWLPKNGDRRARELVAAGIIDRELAKNLKNVKNSVGMPVEGKVACFRVKRRT